jgi:hypothetical protein
MRDAIDFEWLGLPAAVVIADALTGPANAMRRLSGMPEYRYLVTPFPVGNLDADELDQRAHGLAAEAADLLCCEKRTARDPAPSVAVQTSNARAELQFEDADAALTALHARGWTDGAPVVLPTRERVDALLAATARPASEVLIRLATRNDLTANVQDAAVNAVMAGCRPEQFRIVLAALEAAGDPAYNLHAHTATMAGAQQVVIVNGPIRTQLGLHESDGAMGPGWQPNAAIGRALRLVLRNSLRSVHGEFDRASFSHPGRWGWCFAEAEEASPWPSLSVSVSGASAETSTVTLYATTWQASIINHARDAEILLDEIALGVRAACHVNWLHRDAASDSSFYATRPFLFVTGREHARVLSKSGYNDLDRLRTALYDRLVEPHNELRPVAVATPDRIQFVHLNATGMQQTWFLAPFQSHQLVTRRVTF